MKTVKLRFSTLVELWEFLKQTNKFRSYIDFDNSELNGHFTEDEIEIAVKKLNATILV